MNRILEMICEDPAKESYMEALKQPPMLRPMIRILTLTGLGSFIILIAIPLAVRFRFAGESLSLSERLTSGGFSSPEFILQSLLLAGSALIATVALYYLLKRLEPSMEGVAAAQ